MRKLRNQDLYKVFNKATGEIKSSGSTKEDAKKQLRLLKRLEKKEKLTGGANGDEPLEEPIDPDPIQGFNFQAIGDLMQQQGLEEAQVQIPQVQIPQNFLQELARIRELARTREREERIRRRQARIREQMRGGGAGASTQQNRLSNEEIDSIIQLLNTNSIPRIERLEIISFLGRIPDEERSMEENSLMSGLLMYEASNLFNRMLNTRPETPDTEPESEDEQEGAGMMGAGLYADDMKDLLDASYDKRNYDVGDYKIDHDLSDPRVKVYTNEKTGKVLSVHRGSADWRDWLDNYKLVTRGEMKSSNTYKEHKKKQDAINKKYGIENQILLGHSRAGKYVEELNKEKGNKYGETLTYNKATNWTDIGRNNPNNQTDIRVSNDPVSALRFLQKGKNKVTIKNKGFNPFKAHGTGKLSFLGKKLIGKGFNPKKMRVKDMRDFLRDHHKVNGMRKAYGKVPKKQLVEEIKTLEGGYCGCEGGNVEEQRTEDEVGEELNNLRRELESNYRGLDTLPRERRDEILSEYTNRLLGLYDDAFKYRANPKVRNDYNIISFRLSFNDMEAGREYIDSPHSSDDEGEDEDVMEAGAIETHLKPFFCRIGSKRVILNEILKEIPQHVKYVEPFVGGGSVFWNRPPSIRSVINDVDKCLIEGYKLIKKASSDINKYPFPFTEKEYAELRRIDYKRNPKHPTTKKYIKKMQDFVDSKGGSIEKQLLKILYKFCNTFGSKGVGIIYRLERGITKIKNMDEYKHRLKDTSILSDDYKQVIKEHDDKDTFFFLDPPYEGSEKLYKKGELNLEELRKTADGIKGKFLLTLNDSPKVRKAFNGYKIKKIKVAGGAGHGGNQGGIIGIGQKERNELFISNY